MKPLSQCHLYTFLDTAYLEGRAPEEVVRQLCDGGSDLIQLRAKGAAPLEILHLAERIIRLTDRAGVGLVLNDHPDLAAQCGAPLCHLGQEDFFDAGYTRVDELLASLPPPKPRLALGLSTHSPHQAERAILAGADYIAVGPVFATATKPTAAPVTLEYVRWAADAVSLPWFAIGGITLRNVESVLEAGARRICVVSAILNSRDIADACQQFRKHLSFPPKSSN